MTTIADLARALGAEAAGDTVVSGDGQSDRPVAEVVVDAGPEAPGEAADA